eukprot:TRINITY_DN4851_c0_g2_i1.p2 TRINITY_DN4851_c0_g2~~TRINITY_DN4851_c0_g2_i1.p2  ORF type:complete len:101 (+),score=4.68 TRINITY_DN4851_c0_g2_i1:150-452(+)
MQMDLSLRLERYQLLCPASNPSTTKPAHVNKWPFDFSIAAVEHDLPAVIALVEKQCELYRDWEGDYDLTLNQLLQDKCLSFNHPPIYLCPSIPVRTGLWF